MNRGIRHGERLVVNGQTLKGKTTFDKWLIANMQPVRVICFDPKDEDLFPGVEKCYSPGELVERLQDPVVHFVPSSFDRDMLEEACEIVFETPGPYIWWITEAADFSSPSWIPIGMRLGVTRGGKDGKTMIVECQRLSEINPVFRSQADHFFMFVPAPIELDLKTLAGHIGIEAPVIRRELEELHELHGDYSHLWWVRDGQELRACAPIPLDGAPVNTPAHVSTPTADVEDGEESDAWHQQDSARA